MACCEISLSWLELSNHDGRVINVTLPRQLLVARFQQKKKMQREKQWDPQKRSYLKPPIIL